jgi:hypothetical protein
MNKEKPILFSAPMVQAILDGQKTQTRRIVKPQFSVFHGMRPDNSIDTNRIFRGADQSIHCPYPVGTLLWVRETWGSPDADHVKCAEGRKPQQGDRIVYRANPADEYQWGKGKPSQGSFHWRPSIFMPRWASRITLKVTGVRVERLQSISEVDAVAEGMPIDDPIHDYSILWNSINGKGAWENNPWVWVYTFQKI